MGTVHIILPTLSRCAAAPGLQRVLARADHLPDAEPGYLAALKAHFQWPGRALPVAALMREQACHDASTGTWLCADPAWVEPDISGARMLACGYLDLSSDEAQSLARKLRPLFGDNGFQLELTTPARWHLRLPDGAGLPDFDDPEQALGDDLLAHLPQGAEGKRWRMLFNEVQMILHQNPVNTERKRTGKPPANSLWFWGAGGLPAWLKSSCARVISNDPLAAALSTAASIPVQPVANLEHVAAKGGDTLLDLQHVTAEDDCWQHLPSTLFARCHEVHLAFSSGERYRCKRWHRWRIWRRDGWVLPP